MANHLSDDLEFAKQLVEKALNAVLEGEMTDLLGVEKGERSTARRGYRSGHDTRQLHMKVGTVELRGPQDRDGRFSTHVFERYRRSEKALMSTLAEMYVQGESADLRSVRKVTKLAESLCGYAFSYATTSTLVATLDADPQAFDTRALDDTCFPNLILDARYEKVREQGAVHFLRNAVAHTTHQTYPDCVDELKLLWRCSGMKAARLDLRRWVERWGAEPGCDALVTWVEENIDETFSVYHLPRAHRKRTKSTNTLERYNEEIRRRTRAVRIFPNEAACLRRIRALAAETHDQWVKGKRYLSGAIGLDKDAQKLDLKLQEEV